MVNLLSAGFARLKKSRLFWLFIAAETAWGALLAWILYCFGSIRENLSLSVFMPMFYLCVAEAVFCGFFIGVDYSDGTIRNKIAVGHSREKIYLSNLIICASAGSAVMFAHMAAFFVAGFLLIGPAVFPNVVATVYLCAFLNVVAYASLFTMISMLCKKTASATVANIFLSLGLIVSGIYAYAFYHQPEFFADGSANRRYVGGAARALLGFLDAILPSSSALDVMSRGSLFVCLRIILCSLAEAAIFTLIGLWAFGRKNVD